ncbi:MAG: patatin-like phospholipase family protein [Xanthomonadales bacterium]|nr:patatin-like phospholipase family protein [Xanthomonadales bacterium]MCA0198387.1 patatin-like phospholipase family protein [Pseudomonadota bacterium]
MDSSTPARRSFLLCLASISVLLVSGCATLPRNPAPVQDTPMATIPGMPDIRGWAGFPSAAITEDFSLSMRQESAQDFPVGADGVVRYPYLALSGGGANGAFGAGFLNGWTASGQRPVFKMITGVSTGALMAPFVFIGPAGDEALKHFYTTTSNDDVFVAGSVLMALMRRDSMADTRPLASLIAKVVDRELLRKIAAEHARGRRLYMGTVDLDTRRFVIWNMGRVAQYDNEQALKLFHQVMLASSSFPVAFPPVLFEVEFGGQRYDEMHVDGFVGANLFAHVGTFDPTAIIRTEGRAPGREQIYAIHNGQLNPPPSPTERSIGGIAMRVMEVSGRAGVIGDLFREYAFAQRNRSEFHWVTVAETVDLPDPADFDPVRMRELYQIGYEAGRSGNAWHDRPPAIGEATP